MDTRTERRNLAILWLGTYLAAASFSLVMPFLPLLLQEMGIRDHIEVWTGAAFSASFLTSAVMSPIWGALADAVGRKPMIIRSGLAIAAVFLGMAHAASPWQVVALRLANGALAGFIPAALALLATTVPRERLGRRLGTLHTGPAAGLITGPLIGGTLVHLLGVRSTLLVSSGLVLAATALVAVGVYEPPRPRARPEVHPLRDLGQALALRELRVLFGTVLLLQAANQSVEPLVTLYVGSFPGVRSVPFLSGLLVSLSGMALILFSPLWGRLGERAGYTGLLRRSLRVVGVAHLLQAAAPNLWFFGAVRFAMGSFQAAVNPSLSTLVAESVDEGFRGRAFGLLTSVQMLGNLLGPLVGGAWADAFGIRSSFLLASGLALAASQVAAGLAAPGDGAQPPSPAGRHEWPLPEANGRARAVERPGVPR